jgi:predicted  nucleic acid-binding Zn-ribbon protein
VLTTFVTQLTVTNSSGKILLGVISQIAMPENKIFEKLLEHDNRFDALEKRFDAHEKRFDAHDKRFDALEKRFDTLEQEMSEMRNEYLVGQDRIIKILERLDQERVFTTEWIRRIEGELAKVKTHLGIA